MESSNKRWDFVKISRPGEARPFDWDLLSMREDCYNKYLELAVVFLYTF